MTRRRVTTVGCCVWLLLQTAAAVPAQEGPMSATGSVQLSDAKGDVAPMSTSSGTEPALDVVSLAIRSDGRQLTFEATLADPPGTFASSVVDVLIDVDGDPATGIDEFRGQSPGYDVQASVVLCMAYDNGGTACAGGLGDGVTERWGAMELERFEGDHPFGPKEAILSAMAFPGERASEKHPLEGQVVVASLAYSDLGLSSGQTIRLVAKESGGSPIGDDGFFPVVLLTLN